MRELRVMMPSGNTLVILLSDEEAYNYLQNKLKEHTNGN